MRSDQDPPGESGTGEYGAWNPTPFFGIPVEGKLLHPCGHPQRRSVIACHRRNLVRNRLLGGACEKLSGTSGLGVKMRANNTQGRTAKADAVAAGTGLNLRGVAVENDFAL